MVFGLLRQVARIRVTAAYALAVTAVATVLLWLGPQVHERVIRHVSTNLHNLSHGHLDTLLGSAFVVDAGPIYFWLPGLVCLLGLAELLWGSGRLLVAFGLGHVGATLLVAIGLALAVTNGWLPMSVSHATDVGMSYGAAAVVGSLTAAIPKRWRPAWIGWWVAVGIVAVVLGRDFTDIGHAVALGLGMLLSVWFRGPARWTQPTWVLLGVGALFGYLMLANTGPALAIGTASGLVCAAAFGAVVSISARRYAVESPVDHLV
jgi:hypothetical protein